MTEKLKLCPFCGGEAFLVDDDEKNYGVFIACSKCCSSSGIFKTKDEALIAWNSRPIENELEAENARLREALEFYAHGKHLLKASGVVCDAYDIVSGQVENGKYAQEVLEGCAK